jgi:protein-L-isoaspartate(D-aspartate) O-methyltransferase
MIEREDPEAFKHRVQAAFDITGSAYGTAGDFHWQFAERLVGHAPLHLGQRVLDVATGTAPAAILAARLIGPTGLVVGVDLSPGMLTHAQRNIAAAGVASILLMRGDAARLPFLDEQFDVILCSSSIVWFPSIPAALREWRRVLRPGGWLAFSCFGGAARYTTQTLLGAALRPYGIQYFDLNEPLNTPQKCLGALQDAGFARIRIHVEREQMFTSDPGESFEQACGGLRRLRIQLGAEQLEHARTRYIAAFQDLLATQYSWNHDFEQFVVAQRPQQGGL